MDVGCVSINVGSSVVTNGPLWWGLLIVGKAVPVLGQGIYGKSLYFLLNFVVSLKLLLKNKIYSMTETTRSYGYTSSSFYGPNSCLRLYIGPRLNVLLVWWKSLLATVRGCVALLTRAPPGPHGQPFPGFLRHVGAVLSACPSHPFLALRQRLLFLALTPHP